MKPLSYRTYRDRDLLALGHDILQARELWSKRCAEYVAKHGDQGSAVIGAGIVVNLVPPRCRRARPHRILDVPPTAAQCSLSWEESVEEVLAFLRARGVEAWYQPGRMD